MEYPCIPPERPSAADSSPAVPREALDPRMGKPRRAKEWPGSWITGAGRLVSSYPLYFILSYRRSIVAAWARVALLCGLRVVCVVPRMIPASAAQRKALTAQSEILSASV